MRSALGKGIGKVPYEFSYVIAVALARSLLMLLYDKNINKELVSAERKEIPRSSVSI